MAYRPPTWSARGCRRQWPPVPSTGFSAPPQHPAPRSAWLLGSRGRDTMAPTQPQPLAWTPHGSSGRPVATTGLGQFRPGALGLLQAAALPWSWWVRQHLPLLPEAVPAGIAPAVRSSQRQNSFRLGRKRLAPAPAPVLRPRPGSPYSSGWPTEGGSPGAEMPLEDGSDVGCGVWWERAVGSKPGACGCLGSTRKVPSQPLAGPELGVR